MLEKHKEWLDTELASKTKAMLGMRKEHTSSLLDLQANSTPRRRSCSARRRRRSRSSAEIVKLEASCVKRRNKAAGVAQIDSDAASRKRCRRLSELPSRASSRPSQRSRRSRSV